MTKAELTERLANNIRRRRKALGMSIGAVADRADVAEDYLGHIERRKKTPSVEVLVKIASALDLGVDALLGERASPEGPNSATRRLASYLRGLTEAQKGDLLAILAKLRRVERIHALRVALGA